MHETPIPPTQTPSSNFHLATNNKLLMRDKPAKKEINKNNPIPSKTLITKYYSFFPVDFTTN